MRAPNASFQRRAFTLIELLLVIAIIGIMSALIVTAISNTSSDARMVLARQQQAVFQEALNAWISSASSGTNSLQDARTAYNNQSTALAKLSLIQNYLDPSTYAHFTGYTTNTAQLQSEAMRKEGVYLQFTSWATNAYPRVNMGP
ncbi:MAG TPA: type II secretion system protein [Terrimicrobiaceae bacterium]|nr:type II secretion system protein [Terrimicrobiaceae bacterium]